MWIRRHRDPAPPFVDGDGVLVRIALALAEANTVDGVLDTLARELTSTVARASECTISTWDPVGDQLVVVAVGYADTWPEEEERGKRYPLNDYPGIRDLLHHRDGYLEYRASDQGLPDRVREQLAEWQWQTWVSFPLVVRGDAVGVIEVVDYHSTEPWAVTDVRLCQALATLAAVSVRNAQLVAELRDLADRDPLTGLLNHRAFYEALELQHARSLETGEPMAVLVADLDDFKAHNDQYGHLHGDETLRRVARALVQPDSIRRHRRAHRRRRVCTGVPQRQRCRRRDDRPAVDHQPAGHRRALGLCRNHHQPRSRISRTSRSWAEPTTLCGSPRPPARVASGSQTRPDRIRSTDDEARSALVRGHALPARQASRSGRAKFDRCGRGAVRGATMGTIGLLLARPRWRGLAAFAAAEALTRSP